MNENTKIEGLEEVLETLSQMQKSGEQIGQYIQDSTEDSFENQESPFGQAWLPSKTKPKDNPKKQILIDSAILQGSFRVDADDNEVSVLGQTQFMQPSINLGYKSICCSLSFFTSSISSPIF